MTDEALSARVSQLSPQARELLARRLASRRRGDGLAIPRRDPDEPVPMSFAQWRLWFLEQLRPGTNAWNTPIAAHLYGPLDAAALRRSLQLLVCRHATLRTVFSARNGQPVPVVLENPPVELPVIDLARHDHASRDATVRRLIDDEVSRPFDLGTDLMLRVCLLRMNPDEHVLVLVAHHIACDGWSKGLLLEELGTAYDALCVREEPRLAELPIEYADFAIWQRATVSGDNLRRLASYWTSRLGGAAPVLELGSDRPRPQKQGFRGAVEWLSVPAPLAQSVIEIGRRRRATPFMTLLAAFKVLLYAHSDQDDLLVASPAAMRTHPELERIVGLFANTLVYRTSLAGRPSFRELVGRVRETALGVYEHQDLPFEKVVQAVRPPRDPGRNPLVQVNMRVEGPEPELRLRGVRSEPIALDPGIARFDLAIELARSGEGFAGYLEYDAALFDRDTAVAFAGDFGLVLEAAAAFPDEPIADLEPVRRIRARRG